SAKRKKILIAASEALPYVKTGGLADVAAALPKALNADGYDCRVIMPLYFDIPDDFKHTMRYLGNVYVPLAWRNQYCGVFTQTYEGVTYYFIDNEFYFKRRGLYGHYDDGERFAFFSKAILESMSVTEFYPDILHANDWHTAMTPVYLDVFYRGIPALQSVKTVFTIHNIQFQGQYGDGIIGDVLGLPADRASLVMYKGCANYMKGAIECSNVVTTVSPTYAGEILDPYYGYEMEDILRLRGYKLHGIVNGIDTDKNNPATDKALFVNYDLEHYSKKAENKVNLQRMLGLPENPDVAMIGMVGRLTEQKGLDLVTTVLEDIMKMPVQLVVLGQGDWRY
ncbi:MAG: glycogen synthase, partial [Clostridia bacterium]|nr:glycogen synthase [Clostridia bacterium]